MSNNYGEFQGTELDSSADYDYDDANRNDLIPILGISALLAAVVGAILVFLGRSSNPTIEERAGDLMAEARKKGNQGVKSAKRAASDLHLAELLEDARNRAEKAAKDLDLGDVAGEVGKNARHAAADFELGSLLNEALKKSQDALSKVDLGDLGKRARKQATGSIDAVRDLEIDTSGVEGVLEALKQRLSEAIDSVRNDAAPKAVNLVKDDLVPATRGTAETVAKTIRETVVPAAQDAVERLREDVLPAAQKRVGILADDYELADRAQSASKSARDGIGSFSDLLRGVGVAALGKIVEDVFPQAKRAGGLAVDKARDDVLPAARDAAGETARRVRDDVLPRVSEAAHDAPDVLSGMLKLARERVDDALDVAMPFAAEGLDKGKAKATDAATFGRHRAEDIAGGISGAGSGLGGAFSSAGRGVSGAVGGTVSAATHATKELTGFLFWASMLGGLVLLVFVPDRERQKEVWNNTMQLIGEVREMWRDLQGNEIELVSPSTGTSQI